MEIQVFPPETTLCTYIELKIKTTFLFFSVMVELDTSNGVMFPIYDPDTNLVYLCGKVRVEPLPGPTVPVQVRAKYLYRYRYLMADVMRIKPGYPKNYDRCLRIELAAVYPKHQVKPMADV